MAEKENNNEEVNEIPLEKENFVEGKWLLLENAISKVTYQEQKEVLQKVSKHI